MTTLINASTTAGLIQTADTSGNLSLQANGTTILALTSAGAAVTGTLSATGAILAPGAVLQVVTGTTTTLTSNSTSTYADTTLTATITPLYSNSKIIVIGSQSVSKTTNNTSCTVRLFRDATVLGTWDNCDTNTTADIKGIQAAFNVVDSPGSISAFVYKTQFKSSANNASAIVQYASSLGTLILMEIKQ